MRNRVNPFIRAHGAEAGPLMRPILTGAISSALASVVVGLLWFGISRHSTPGRVLLDPFIEFLYLLVYSVIAGSLYGKVYRRAANDPRGGWLFGASAGFILWMVNPAIWWSYASETPLLIGKPALVFMVLHVLHGTVLGLAFPWVHREILRQSFPEGAHLKPPPAHSRLSPSKESWGVSQGSLKTQTPRPR